jgi:hypothetical protein
VYLWRTVVGEEQQQRALALLVFGEPLEQDADDRRVDERRLAEIDHERRLAAERRGEVGAHAGRDVRIRFAVKRDHRESGFRRGHGFSIARHPFLKPQSAPAQRTATIRRLTASCITGSSRIAKKPHQNCTRASLDRP